MTGPAPYRRAAQKITILGVGNILFKDEGLGVRAIERLNREFRFSDNLRLVDGGVLGLQLMGIVAECDLLILVDAVKNGQPPGTIYRLEGDQVPRRIRAKQSLHELDVSELLAMCHIIDKTPRIVVIGVEPADIATMDLEMTPVVAARMDDLIAMITAELERCGASCALLQSKSIDRPAVRLP